MDLRRKPCILGLRNCNVTDACAFLVACLFLHHVGSAAGGHRFEVASITKGDERSPIKFAVSGRRFIYQNGDIMDLLLWAYHVGDWQVQGAPGWLRTERYDIEAVKPEGARADLNIYEDQDLRLMVQSLLEERCKFRLHRQAKPGLVYDMVVSKKDGAHLRPAVGTADQNEFRGVGQGPRTSRGATLVGRNASMDDLALRLAGIVGRPVVNRTDLRGRYDFLAEYASRDEDDAPSIFTAIEDQIGLKLNRVRGLEEILVVDSIDRPSAN